MSICDNILSVLDMNMTLGGCGLFFPFFLKMFFAVAKHFPAKISKFLFPTVLFIKFLSALTAALKPYSAPNFHFALISVVTAHAAIFSL